MWIYKNIIILSDFLCGWFAYKKFSLLSGIQWCEYINHVANWHWKMVWAVVVSFQIEGGFLLKIAPSEFGGRNEIIYYSEISQRRHFINHARQKAAFYTQYCSPCAIRPRCKKSVLCKRKRINDGEQRRTRYLLFWTGKKLSQTDLYSIWTCKVKRDWCW